MFSYIRYFNCSFLLTYLVVILTLNSIASSLERLQIGDKHNVSKNTRRLFDQTNKEWPRYLATRLSSESHSLDAKHDDPIYIDGNKRNLNDGRTYDEGSGSGNPSDFETAASSNGKGVDDEDSAQGRINLPSNLGDNHKDHHNSVIKIDGDNDNSDGEMMRNRRKHLLSAIGKEHNKLSSNDEDDDAEDDADDEDYEDGGFSGDRPISRSETERNNGAIIDNGSGDGLHEAISRLTTTESILSALTPHVVPWHKTTVKPDYVAVTEESSTTAATTSTIAPSLSSSLPSIFWSASIAPTASTTTTSTTTSTTTTTTTNSPSSTTAAVSSTSLTSSPMQIPPYFTTDPSSSSSRPPKVSTTTVQPLFDIFDINKINHSLSSTPPTTTVRSTLVTALTASSNGNNRNQWNEHLQPELRNISTESVSIVTASTQSSSTSRPSSGPVIKKSSTKKPTLQDKKTRKQDSKHGINERIDVELSGRELLPDTKGTSSNKFDDHDGDDDTDDGEEDTDVDETSHHIHVPFENVDPDGDEEDDTDLDEDMDEDDEEVDHDSGSKVTESENRGSNRFNKNKHDSHIDKFNHHNNVNTHQRGDEDDEDDLDEDGELDSANTFNNEVSILGRKTESRQSRFFTEPGILAAVIGGAVVGLLCAILLVMFIVYRMRKKDEGSYPVDEPKMSPMTSHFYGRGNSRELYT